MDPLINSKRCGAFSLLMQKRLFSHLFLNKILLCPAVGFSLSISPLIIVIIANISLLYLLPSPFHSVFKTEIIMHNNMTTDHPVLMLLFSYVDVNLSTPSVINTVHLWPFWVQTKETKLWRKKMLMLINFSNIVNLSWHLEITISHHLFCSHEKHLSPLYLRSCSKISQILAFIVMLTGKKCAVVHQTTSWWAFNGFKSNFYPLSPAATITELFQTWMYQFWWKVLRKLHVFLSHSQ